MISLTNKSKFSCDSKAMGARDQLTLQVYVKQACETCDRARKIAQLVDAEFPNVSVEIVDLSTPGAQRDDVFAVPTFVLEDHILSLGNPQEGELREEITALLRLRGLV